MHLKIIAHRSVIWDYGQYIIIERLNWNTPTPTTAQELIDQVITKEEVVHNE